MRVKDGAAPATLTIRMWNYTSGAWDSLDTASVSGSAEVLRSVPLGASVLGRYVTANGVARVQVAVDRWQSTTHDVSHDLVGLTLTQ